MCCDLSLFFLSFFLSDSFLLGPFVSFSHFNYACLVSFPLPFALLNADESQQNGRFISGIHMVLHAAVETMMALGLSSITGGVIVYVVREVGCIGGYEDAVMGLGSGLCLLSVEVYVSYVLMVHVRQKYN